MLIIILQQSYTFFEITAKIVREKYYLTNKGLFFYFYAIKG